MRDHAMESPNPGNPGAIMDAAAMEPVEATKSCTKVLSEKSSTNPFARPLATPSALPCPAQKPPRCTRLNGPLIWRP